MSAYRLHAIRADASECSESQFWVTFPAIRRNFEPTPPTARKFYNITEAASISSDCGLREKTVTISFRIGETAFKALQDEAKKNNISLNTLANQLFTAYADYDRFLQKFHMIKLSSPTFKRILNAASKEAITEVGRSAGASVPESFILAKMGEINQGNAVEYLRLMGTYANPFDYSQVALTGKGSITLTHDLGINGSLFLASYVESLFKNAGKSAKISQYENGITIEL